ncbi:MAG: cell division protein FtsQ/DivIB [Prevotellaceae bacterium]|nr:cell division protein FtsQ/DivIB [Prevotellaceae bacterium]
MFRRIVLIVILAVVATYLVVAVTTFNRKPTDAVCRDITLIIKDSVNTGFITKKEITELLTAKGINPVGRPMDDILCLTLENELARQPLVASVNCYKTIDNNICVEVSQRIPILRVYLNSTKSYYIDKEGTIILPDIKNVTHLPIATGRIEESFATTNLRPFALFLQQNKFWKSQIEQINVLPNHNIELIPLVGNHILYLGKLDNYQNKLARAKRFYEKALNHVGWNKYSRISVEFDNQIICTKKQ